jgi:hypothetical protein
MSGDSNGTAGDSSSSTQATVDLDEAWESIGRAILLQKRKYSDK